LLTIFLQERSHYKLLAIFAESQLILIADNAGDFLSLFIAIKIHCE